MDEELRKWLPEGYDDLPFGKKQVWRRKAAFLEAYSKRGIVLDGVQAAGVTYSLVSQTWRKSDDEHFKAMYALAEEMAGDNLEQLLHDRVRNGIAEPVIYQGQPTFYEDPETGERRILTVSKFSDRLLELAIKARKPERYRENVKTTHAVEGDGRGVLVVPAAVDPRSWAEAAAEQQAPYAGNEGDKEG